MLLRSSDLDSGTQEYDWLFGQSSDLLCVVDTATGFQRVNPTFVSTLGYTLDDLRSTQFLDLVHPDDLSSSQSELELLKSGEPTVSFQNRFLAADGEYKHLAWTVCCSDSGGETGSLHALARDITAKHQDELPVTGDPGTGSVSDEPQDLKQLELLATTLGSVLNRAPDGFLLTDIERRVIWFNPSLQHMFGLESLELVGQRTTAFRSLLKTTVANPEQFNSRIDAIYADHNLIVAEELVEISSPKPIALSRSSIPVRSDDGEYLGRLWIYRDVTASRAAERARLEAELKNRHFDDVQLAKGMFISTISHELRTPLTSILAFSGLLKRNPGDVVTERDVRHLDAILRSGERLKQLINNLLDIADLEHRMMQIHTSEFMLSESVDSVVTAVAPLLDLKSQAVTVNIDLPDTEMVSDREHFEQILGNLLSNASKYSEHGSVITIDARVAGEKLELSVIDRGEGIHQDMLYALFEPFSRLDNELTRANQGSGLGLAISRRLARSLGGDITVESKIDEGSVFTVTVPLKIAVERAA